jgi:hypothetical protein
MASVPRMTHEGTPLLGESFVFPSYGNVGPLYITTLSLPGFTIGLPVWLLQFEPSGRSLEWKTTKPVTQL